MARCKIFSLVATCILCTIAACSRQAPGVGTSAAQTAGQSTAVSGNACERKLIAAQDVTGLLGAAVTAYKNIPGDPQTCEFGTATGFSSVTISVRPGHGMAAVGMYTSGKMDEFEKSTPLAGFGDAAVRSLQLNRVVARKGDLLCEVTGPGLAKGADDPAIHALAALCNKIFAAY